MAAARPRSVALVWAQFAAYHIDRCEAVARRLESRAQVLAVEVATTSRDYAWEPSGEVAGARKVTLFPGTGYEQVSAFRRFRALWRVLWRQDVVCIGLSYAEPMVVVLTWALTLAGVRVVVFSESKFDDRPRHLAIEWLKAACLSCYRAAIVGGPRQIAYFRLLGFRKRPVLPGYDGVGLDRIRAQAGGVVAPQGAPFADRPFIFVGRFVDKKNLLTLIEAFALYRREAGADARGSVLVGSGPLEAEMRARIAALGLEDAVTFPGFLDAAAVSRTLAGSLALILPSVEEQWGLVVNEALALGLPAIVSFEVGSREALVRNLINGYVVESGSVESLAEAMAVLGKDEDRWSAMVAASHKRAWLGDTERLADAVDLVLDPANARASAAVDEFLKMLET